MTDHKKEAVVKEGSKQDATQHIGGGAKADKVSPTTISDPSGTRSNRLGGTDQAEPTPEELPADAKIAPIAEQLAPNQAAQAVGALPQPKEVAGVPQPKEGEKNVTSDQSDPDKFLGEGSKQTEDDR